MSRALGGSLTQLAWFAGSLPLPLPRPLSAGSLVGSLSRLWTSGRDVSLGAGTAALRVPAQSARRFSFLKNEQTCCVHMLFFFPQKRKPRQYVTL
jgi:hypothetical protein